MDGALLLIVLTCAVAVAALARQRDVQPSLVIVTLAGAASFIPGIPRFELAPEAILSIVVPPLLFAATRNFAFSHFVRNARPILGLGVGLVVVTGLTAGAAASWLIPGLALASALVLGAVVSPPDTVTIVAHGHQLGMSRRVVAILTGECLVNDAAALAMFAATVAAVTGSHPFISNPVLLFCFSAAVGTAIGLVLGVATNVIRSILRSSSLETVLGLVLPFSAYLLAEHAHGSGILAVVAAGFCLGTGSTRLDYRTRLQEDQVWHTLGTLLETFVFAYMGMQLATVVSELRETGPSPVAVAVAGLAVLVVVIVVRIAGVFALFGQHRLLRRLGRRPRRPRRDRRRGREPLPPLTAKDTVVVSWTGMRGIVTLAAAGGIPLTIVDGSPFPDRPLIQAIAFIVAVGTLLIQGSTLPWLIRTLSIDDDAGRRAESKALEAAENVSAKAARHVLEEVGSDPKSDPRLVRMVNAYLARDRAADQAMDDGDERLVDQAARLWRRMAAAQRAALLDQWRTGRLEEDAVRTVMARIDLKQAALEVDREDD